MLQPYKSFGMVCAELPCTNHAKPSLRSGADLKVKLMFDGRLRRQNSIYNVYLTKDIHCVYYCCGGSYENSCSEMGQ